MFKTIKSKIKLITITMIVSLAIVLGFFMYIHFEITKNFMVQNAYYSIAALAQDINKQILRIEDNAKDLALSGKFFKKINDTKHDLEFGISKTFDNYKDSLGGGIWFEPYVINPNKRLFAVYAYRNKNNKVVIDNEFESEEYNYLNQKWYKEITKEIKEEHQVVWSKPYYEHEGSNTLMMTAGAGIYDEDNKLIGISTVDWEINSILNMIRELRPTPNSFSLFGDKKNDIVIATTDPYLNSNEIMGVDLHKIPWYTENLKDTLYIKYHNTIYIPYVKNLSNGMIYIVFVPKNELFRFIIIQSSWLITIFILIIIVISYLLYKVLRDGINNPIDKLINIANKISEGELNEYFEIKEPREFSHLASVFNKMTKDIKQITKEREKIESELSIAKEIQSSSLPNTFPPYPNRHDFEIFASMDAAKEVGGDFYDFYFLDDDKFMFLIADVSGKGIPAALFMMTAKTIISNIAQMNLPPKQMIKEINNTILNNNKQGFFITAFIGITDTKTGKTHFINCGHNPPLLKRRNEKFEYLQTDPNLVLGIVENVDFTVYETFLNKGDIIFLYTDGVTEAINKEDKLYGEKRLLDKINNNHYNNTQEIIKNIKNDVANFSKGTFQNDDITMLTYKYTEENKYKYKNKADIKLYGEFLNWILEFNKKEDLDPRIAQKLEFSSEEIYTNICSYAYPDNKDGELEAILYKNEDNVIIQFIDEGIPYNPLAKEDPDVELPIEERTIGGLGIFMVKNTVSKMEYEYKDNKNILTLTI